MSRSLRTMLKHSYSVILKSLSESNVNPWIRDNFYVIDRHYRSLLKNKKAFSFGEFYEILHIYCQRCDYSADPKTLTNYLNSQSRHFTYWELINAKAILALNTINKLGEVLEENKTHFLLPNSVKTLISLSDPQYDDVIRATWRPEKIISGYETDYHRFDDETKFQYGVYIAEYARAHSLSESESAKYLVAEAKRKSIPLGNLLFRPLRKYAIGWCVSVGVVFAALLILGIYCFGWMTALLAVPFALAAASLSDQLISIKCPAYRAPRLKIDAIPKNAKTLVAVAALMTGGKNDDDLFRALANFRCMNPDKNLYFCLLADLPDSDEQYHVEDEIIIRSAQKNIDELNQTYGESFCLFFRDRVLNKSEDRFGGWERKRGAVCELVSHIVHGDKREYYGGDFIREIKYILTLDSDTNLSVGTARELVSIALHPVNRPVIKDGRVIWGYGIIQPTIRTELSSAYKTGFSRLISGAGGADIYSTAGFHRSQSLFGSGNFCGKGLIDVALFDRYINGKLPEGLVLSHDSIEGSILRTLCASDITLTDSTPGNTVSFFRRLHRWMRGDLQNLYFLKGNLLSALSKWRLVLTSFRHTAPLFSLLAIICGCFLSDTSGFLLFLLAYADLFLPCLFMIFRFLFFGAPFALRRFFSKAYSLLTQTCIRFIFELSSSARRAVLNLHAYCLSAIRLFTRKKTLEWTTAAQTEKLSSSLGKYVLDSYVSVLIGLLILVLARPPFMRFCGLLYFVYPLISVVLSRPIDGGIMAKPNLTEAQKNLLLAHAKDMFGFYNDNVGEKTNHLPPDNVQYSPVASIAMRTSPTNIGFYLVSLLAARDMEIIDSRSLANRLDSALTSVEKLEKYYGNLYNWYDISNLSVIGDRFISAVDSGNFIVMLVALKEGLYEYSDEEPQLREIICRLKNLISETDLTPLYDFRRNLFKIGIKPDEDNSNIGCYDLLMSEARMTAYYAVASNIVPKKHWQSLGRTLTHKSGYIGMMSWSGTAFEYLMPQLFLPLYRDSFLYESIAFSLMLQRMTNPLWGVSESGFYSFDSEMNYQYKANGIQTLALRRIAADERVISPYSTYLSLCLLGNSAVKNLKNLESRGMYGKYGLYEALDMNNGSGGIAVKSYMAHHVGMSIIAVMNGVKDNIFVRRFMSDRRMFAAKELLQEKIPVDAHIFEDGKKQTKTLRHREPSMGVTQKTDLNTPACALLSRGDMSAVISSNGHIAFTNGEIAVSNTVFDKFSLRFSPVVIFSRGNRSFGCTPLYGVDANYSFERGDGYACHIASGKDFSARVKYSISKNCNCLVVNTRAEALKKYDITFAFEPVLDTEKNFRSHISFSRLFVESEYDKSKRILYFHRRSRSDGAHTFTVAVAPRDKDMSLSFLTSREGFAASSVTSPMDYAACSTNNHVGECIDPFCLVRTENADGGRASFLITWGATKKECEGNIRAARTDKGEYPLPEHNEVLASMLPDLLYGKGISLVDSFSKCSINDLWSKSISGDYPLAVISVSSSAVTRTREVLSAFKTLARACIRCELVFMVSDSDKYNRPVENSVRNCCADMGCSKYLGRKNGIFILRRQENSEAFIRSLKSFAYFYLDFDNDLVKETSFSEKPLVIIEKPLTKAPLSVPEKALKTNYGYFGDESFTVDKSKLPPAPYSYILTGYRFSTVLTQSSLGYTFFDNARERRICSFFGDSKTLDNGERLFLIKEDKKYDLCAVSNKVIYEKGKAIYFGEIEGNTYSVTVAVSPKFPVKLIRVRMSAPQGISFELKPVMGDSIAPVNGIEVLPVSENGNSCILFRNPFGMTFPEGIGFAGVYGGESDTDKCSLSCNGTDIIFFLGACATERGARNVVRRVNKNFYDAQLNNAQEFASSMIPDIQVTTKSKYTDKLLDYFLPYQISACRFYARGSFYQSGGAYGFRDQLQDSLGMIYSDPMAVRTHIIRCCAHQYEDGSVMHWWHTRNYGHVNRGIKSKCSDDLLYLPFVLADYLEKTGDESILHVPVHYLTSPPLNHAAERYEQPNLSHIRESVFHHCLRAMDHAFKKGKHGLILMGSCDWNDAFSLVGEKGIGESVFSTLLYIISAKAFIPICEKIGYADRADRLRKNIEELRSAVEENAFFGDRYARAFCDDGKILGIEESEECKIDILSQAFAAMAGLDENRTKTALNTAFTRLYDSKNRIFKLFDPPFSKGNARVGYIRGYASGIRENGGQYTHGALWGALGCIAADMQEEALLILACADPASRSADRELAEKYKTEPYVISADIYSGEFSGRGGWSWYTGAAAWFYRIMIEYVLGLKFGADQTLLSAKPIIPYEAEMVLGKSSVHVRSSADIQTPLLNGEKIEFPFQLKEGKYILELPSNK